MSTAVYELFIFGKYPVMAVLYEIVSGECGLGFERITNEPESKNKEVGHSFAIKSMSVKNALLYV